LAFAPGAVLRVRLRAFIRSVRIQSSGPRHDHQRSGELVWILCKCAPQRYIVWSGLDVIPKSHYALQLKSVPENYKVAPQIIVHRMKQF
jgi:hypothetical protein